MKPAQPNDCKSVPVILFANVLPNGSGGSKVVPQKPVLELTSRQAAQVLNLSRGTLSGVVNSEMGQKHLRWRWTTARKGKRVFAYASVLAYRDASKDPNFGEGAKKP